MKVLVLFGLLTFLMVFIYYASKAYYQNIYEQTKHKASDADIFKIMANSNHFITVEQLTARTELTKKEAANRLASLAMEGALRRYYDGNGIKTVYQLIEGVPLFDSLPADLNGLSEDQIIAVILLHVDDAQVTVAELVVIFGINISEAKIVLSRLKKAGKLNVLYNKGFRKIHVINKSLHNPQPVLRAAPHKRSRTQLAIPAQEKIKIPDATVLQLAIEYDGRLTPTLVCIKLEVSMDEAKLKLEQLHEQGVFEIAIDEKNALLEYQIRDRTLLG